MIVRKVKPFKNKRKTTSSISFSDVHDENYEGLFHLEAVLRSMDGNSTYYAEVRRILRCGMMFHEFIDNFTGTTIFKTNHITKVNDVKKPHTRNGIFSRKIRMSDKLSFKYITS